MSDYKGIARKFRPQTFEEVLGQEAIVTTLKNAIKFARLAHAYLFCGSRGTGKTTLARVFAKAINCTSPAIDLEPCNSCSSCKEIASGNSLDVLEIDGASNRSIEDIRQINETVAYSTASGKYKIYIIDEVHMLTKEAFNALLKTLEEPPPRVLFFFATTEPHKVLPTILSRCQRFNLKRISSATIVLKLRKIADQLGRKVADEALRLISVKAEGGLRDAESLLDQILAFHDGAISEEDALLALGAVPRDLFFSLDREGKAGNLAAAFSIASQIFNEGKDLPFFIEGLLEHFRNISLIKLSGKQASFLDLSDEEREKYALSADCYTKEQLLSILDICLDAQREIRSMPSLRIAIEALLLRIMRTHHKIPIEHLVERLTELEKKISACQVMPKDALIENPGAPEKHPVQKPAAANDPESQTSKAAPHESLVQHFTIDPTPTLEDLKGFAPKSEGNRKPAPLKSKEADTAPQIVKAPSPQESLSQHLPSTLEPNSQDLNSFIQKSEEKPLPLSKLKQQQIDTILQFAACELEGRIQKK